MSLATDMNRERMELEKTYSVLDSMAMKYSGYDDDYLPVFFDEKLPASTPIEPRSFPEIVKGRGEKIAILPTSANLRHLIKSYGISMIYDEAIKSQEIIIPSADYYSHDLTNEANYQRILDLAVLNGIPLSVADRIPVVMQENTINPVRDWILSKEWDKKSRILELCDTLVVDDSDIALTEKIIKTWLIQCVAALDKGQIGLKLNKSAIAKYELILVLQGSQGLKKTSWFKSLLPHEVNGKRFAERYIKDGSNLDLNSKDSIKQNISCWINELGELDATFKKSDIAALKAFCSNSKDRIRLPYAKTECDFIRSCSFCGSVNDEQFLSDTTGSRRFGVVRVLGIYEHDIDMQQLWREVWDLYANGAKWWLDKSDETEMQQRNSLRHQTIDPVEDAILTKFDWEEKRELWNNKLTATEIYQGLFDKKPNRKDLNAIKPTLLRLGVKYVTIKGADKAVMPSWNYQK